MGPLSVRALGRDESQPLWDRLSALIYTRRKNGIDYSIGALPIGGMVDIAGLGSEEEMVAVGKETAAIGTAATTVEGIQQEGSKTPTRLESYLHSNPNAPFGERLFQDSSLGWRFWTLFAGPLMNFLFAFLLFIGLFSIWGAIDYEKSKQINVIGTVRLNTPADAAGLQAGDKVIAINDVKTDNTAWLAQTIRDSNVRLMQAPLVASTAVAVSGGTARAEFGSKPIEPLALTIVRDGQTLQKR